MKYIRTSTAIYTILHFFVDFTTVFLIINVLLGPGVGLANRGVVVILYNLIAFVGQLPVGMIADVVNKNKIIAVIGCVLSGISYPIAFISPWCACIVAALGNAAFHIGGGTDILNMTMPKSSYSGIFVSSGAFGVWLAYKSNYNINIWIFPVFMMAGVILLLLLNKKAPPTSKIQNITYKKPRSTVVVAIICFVLTIVLRSLLGMIMNFSWKAIPVLSVLFVLAVVIGKAAGGFLGDRFGYVKTVSISLSIAAISFVFAMDYWVAGIIGVMCFNMTMPITLTAIARECNRKYGFAFGITTFALFVGFVPTVFGANRWFGVPLLVGGSVVSLILMLLGYAILKKKNKKDKNICGL